MDHATLDTLSSIGGLAASVAAVLAVLYVFLAGRRDSREKANHDSQTKQINDGEAELAKQGDRINRHATEIRHIQQKTQTRPFDPHWDR